MLDPVEAVAAGNAVVSAVRSGRSAKKTNASNVVLVSESRPRRLDGYRIVCTVLNRSTVGVADLAVSIRMQVGQLEIDGEVVQAATLFARRALAGGDSVELEFPHVARLREESFDVCDQKGAGFAITLYWRDESGKRWRRTDGSGAVRCRLKDYPSPQWAGDLQ